MTAPLAYTAFHLNLAFSSIEVEDRAAVIQRCYWPLLRLAEKDFPIGLEATSYTLKEIERLDPAWIRRCRTLIDEGKIELIGSGYVQMIAPLVPAEMTRRNLMFGMQDYEALLGAKPKVALINEQAFSRGLVPLYLEAGFEAIIMDCAEPASHHKAWDPAWVKTPQYVAGEGGSKIPVIWSDAISFQKLQRYAHSEIEADEYLEFLNLQLESGVQAFPLYTSDAEIFDYRPGRFSSEAAMAAFSEFDRIELLLGVLKRSGALQLGLPSDALTYLNQGGAPLALESAQMPVPVKKQRKYNLLRWAVTGRADLKLNTLCWRLFEAMRDDESAHSEDWRQLCRWWASDLRTHITSRRWKALEAELEKSIWVKACHPDRAVVNAGKVSSRTGRQVDVRTEGRFLIVEGQDFHIALNKRRGLTIQSMGFGSYEPTLAGAPAQNSLIGTLAHGFYPTIEFGADFYTGHFVTEPAGRHKITDLVPVEPIVRQENDIVIVTGHFKIDGQNIEKLIEIDTAQRRVTVAYHPSLKMIADGNSRFAYVTLNPRAFEKEKLFFECENGGHDTERFPLWQAGRLQDVDHGAPVSRLVSATTGLGLTDGTLVMGDDQKYVRLKCARTDVAAAGLLTAKNIADTFFVRAALTLAESDETRKEVELDSLRKLAPLAVRYSIEVGRRDEKDNAT